MGVAENCREAMLALASRRLTTDQRFAGIASNKLLDVDAIYMARTAGRDVWGLSCWRKGTAVGHQEGAITREEENAEDVQLLASFTWLQGQHAQSKPGRAVPHLWLWLESNHWAISFTAFGPADTKCK